MGTTLTAAALVGDEPDGQLRLALVNVGDSRGYLLDRSEERVHKLTEDHSVVEEMVRSGELTPGRGGRPPPPAHPDASARDRARHRGRLLGARPPARQPAAALQRRADERARRSRRSREVLLEEADVEIAASELVRLALQRGGTDNVTVVVIEVLGGDAAGVSDDVVSAPRGRRRHGRAGVAGESAAITEAVALTPATAGPSGPAAPRTAAAPVAVVATAAEPRPAYTRPLVLVPQQRRQRRQRGRDRIVTFRVVLFVLVFVAVLGRCRRRRRLVQQRVVLRRPRSRLRGDLPGTSRRPAVVQALGRGAHVAQAVRAAGVECRVPETRDGGELIPGGSQPRARPSLERQDRRRGGRRRRRLTSTGRHDDVSAPVAAPAVTVTTTTTRRHAATTSTTPRLRGRRGEGAMINRRIRWLGFVLLAVLRPAVPAAEQLPGPPGTSARRQPAATLPTRTGHLDAAARRHLQRRRARPSPIPSPPTTATASCGSTRLRRPARSPT